MCIFLHNFPMSESAFKNWINESVVQTIANEIAKNHKAFDKKSFEKVSNELSSLELKARVLLITKQLKSHLPADYLKSLKIIQGAINSNKITGFSLWPFSEFIGQYGLDHFDESMQAMYNLTQNFTSEFCVRPFLIKDHQKVLSYFKKWSADENVHVRRWVSEGSRPLLPWGLRIERFKKDPSYTLPLLNALKFDEELYVRKSVANHLNDISKHHPRVVIETLRNWEKKCPKEHLEKLNWIKRHSLRTLIKKGNPDALKLMGVGGPAKVKVSKIRIKQPNLKIGDTLEFNFDIQSTSTKRQKIVVDYAIYFIKKNGSSAPKVFKLKTFEIPSKEKVKINKRHSLKKITTMVYNSGVHKLALQINGKVFQTISFKLKT